MADLFGNAKKIEKYEASNIEVLEGLEPVRHRPGMYIGGTDDRALHHLAAEILDNAMDEAVAGHANRIESILENKNRLNIREDGRGVTINTHPKFLEKSAVELFFTNIDSGIMFSVQIYSI